MLFRSSECPSTPRGTLPPYLDSRIILRAYHASRNIPRVRQDYGVAGVVPGYSGMIVAMDDSVGDGYILSCYILSCLTNANVLAIHPLPIAMHYVAKSNDSAYLRFSLYAFCTFASA